MVNIQKNKGKNRPDKFWFDNITGMTVTDQNTKIVADAVGGKVEGELITVPGGHGELVIRRGDFVGTDQVGVWHIVRTNSVGKNEMMSMGGKAPAKN